ncbi:hypothetical protein BC937DRAFT_95228 [Endogone sp. FLAS-F59071]|nr:hypothetical protein BC937DRAFT_95228 [Endogone sp. FLAS-F59071]|eukprot:RUS13504.1 hypothetical protein BC937DRAFT_95228 [Endogone sp. FLAS-F59071]
MSSSIHIAGDFLRHEVPPNEDEELRNSIYQSFYSAGDNSGYYDMASGIIDNSMDSLPPPPPPPPPPPRPSIPPQPSTRGGAGPTNVDTGLEGLQVLSRLIDKIMAKVKVEARDTLLRVHHRSELNLGGRNGTNHFAFSSFGGSRPKKDYYVDFSIPLISYRDETPGLNDNNAQTFPTTPAPMGSSSIMLPPVPNESIKVVSIESPTVWIREGEGAVRAEDTSDAISIEDEDEGQEEEFFNSEEDLALGEEDMVLGEEDVGGAQRESSTRYLSNQMHGAKRQSSPNNTRSFYSALIFSTLDQDNSIKLKLRPAAPPEYEFSTAGLSSSNVYTQQAATQSARPANIEVDALVTSICTVLCPEQVVFLAELAMAMGSVSGTAEAKQAPPTTEEGRGDVGLDDMEELDLGLRPYPSQEPVGRNSADQVRYNATQRGLRKDMPGGFGSEPMADRRHTGAGQYGNSFGGGDRARASMSAHPAPSVLSPFKTPVMQQPPTRSSGYGSSALNGVSTGSSAAGRSSVSVPALKIKFRIETIECFFLYRDPEGEKDVPKEKVFFKSRSPESLDTDHLKLKIGNLVIRYHDWGDGGKNGAKRRSEGAHFTASSHGASHHRSSSSSRPASSSSSSRPTSTSATSSSSRMSTLEINLATFYITEWLACPPPGTPDASPDKLEFDSTTSTNPTGEGRKTTQGSRPLYRVYNPILEFDNDLPQSYEHAADFPTFLVSSKGARQARQARQPQQATMGPPPKSGSSRAQAKGVVRVTFEMGNRDGGQSMY